MSPDRHPGSDRPQGPGGDPDLPSLARALRGTAAAERLHARGWDWTPSTLGPGFYGQVTEATPGDARQLLEAARRALGWEVSEDD